MRVSTHCGEAGLTVPSFTCRYALPRRGESSTRVSLFPEIRLNV
ncbi:Uncharacterised protein [Mycobacteroides abscessus subsp. abscessus]|nr:Uncharacterised protein [Mycobacteroides abscessus subsp. abscessus]